MPKEEGCERLNLRKSEINHRSVERKGEVKGMREEPLNHVLIRFSIYTAAFSAFILLLPIIVGSRGPVVFTEGGPIEWLQLLLLTTCAALFVLESIQNSGRRGLLIFLASLTILASIRELDFFLDRVNPWGGYGTPAALLFLATGIFTYRNRTHIWKRFAQMMSGRAFPILWCGFLVAVSFAQPFGHQEFLRLIIGIDYNRFVKNVIEEGGELVGYMLILIGTMEAVLECRRERKLASRENGKR
jgi:hypothetical protein